MILEIAVATRHSSNAQQGEAGVLSEAELQATVRDSLPRLLRLARRLAGDEELAEEAVQDALLRIARSWRMFRGQSTLETWMTTIVIRCVRDSIKKRTKDNLRYHDGCEDVEPIDGREPLPAKAAECAEMQRALRIAATRLPDRQREVFALVVWEQMAADDVAVLLGIDRQAVYANLHAARTRLRIDLREFLDR